MNKFIRGLFFITILTILIVGLSKTSNAQEGQIINRNDSIHVMVDEMPQFPGGDLALRKFIATNVRYPNEARDRDIQGKVYIRFIVTILNCRFCCVYFFSYIHIIERFFHYRIK